MKSLFLYGSQSKVEGPFKKDQACFVYALVMMLSGVREKSTDTYKFQFGFAHLEIALSYHQSASESSRPAPVWLDLVGSRFPRPRASAAGPASRGMSCEAENPRGAGALTALNGNTPKLRRTQCPE